MHSDTTSSRQLGPNSMRRLSTLPVLTGLSRHLIHRMIDGMWEMRKQAKYLEAAPALLSADSAVLPYFQRKFKPYAPTPSQS